MRKRELFCQNQLRGTGCYVNLCRWGRSDLKAAYNIDLGDEADTIDLTSIITVGHGVSMAKMGVDGFPAFKFDAGHNVMDEALDIFPTKLFEEFSIIVKIR